MSEQFETRREAEKSSPAGFWHEQLTMAEKREQAWQKTADEIQKRYRAEEQNIKTKRMNMLWSTTETLLASVFGKMAMPDIRRRYRVDDTGRDLSEVLERSIVYSTDVNDDEAALEAAIIDSLLAGRGVCRVILETDIASRAVEVPPIMDQTFGFEIQPGRVEIEEFIADQRVPIEYVYWKDYRESPARTWDGVWWVAYRHEFTRDEMKDLRFPEYNSVPLDKAPMGSDKEDIPDVYKKATVWEIWDKTKRKRYWVHPSHKNILKTDDDPLKLEGFFPQPNPLFSIRQTDTRVPTPEFEVWKDQADELDRITHRISMLIEGLKRRGIYDKTQEELQKLKNAPDNTLIGADNWVQVREKGGLAGVVDWEDITQIAQVLQGLYAQRDVTIQTIFEITGISDIIRGNSKPSETATAQQLKAQFGSIRLRKRQQATQKFIRNLFRLKSELIAEHFEPEVLQQMTGVQVTPDMVQVMRDDRTRGYRIDVETDSTVLQDEQADKESRIEFLTAMGNFFQQAVPIIQAMPQSAPLVGEMLMFVMRGFKIGRTLEDTAEAVMEQLQAMAQQPRPNPAAEAAKMEMEAKIQSAQHDLQVRGATAAQDMQIKEAETAQEMKHKQEMHEVDRAIKMDQAETAREVQKIKASETA